MVATTMRSGVVRERINNGAVNSDKLANDAVNSAKVVNDSLSGDDIDESTLAGLWLTGGNAGTDPASDFLGTTDNQPLNLRVNNQRALRLEPHTTSPNVIGGHATNFVMPGALGATISGGGEPTGSHRVGDDWGTVGGGWRNLAGNSDSDTSDRA